MIDEEDSAPAPTGDSHILYDYYKYLTSLCIFSLGGVLALAEKVPPDGRGRELILGALGVIALAGVLAFTGVGEIVRARSEGDAVNKRALRYTGASPLLLSVGLGMFTYLLGRSLFG